MSRFTEIQMATTLHCALHVHSSTEAGPSHPVLNESNELGGIEVVCTNESVSIGYL